MDNTTCQQLDVSEVREGCFVLFLPEQLERWDGEGADLGEEGWEWDSLARREAEECLLTGGGLHTVQPPSSGMERRACDATSTELSDDGFQMPTSLATGQAPLSTHRQTAPSGLQPGAYCQSTPKQGSLQVNLCALVAPRLGLCHLSARSPQAQEPHIPYPR